MTSFKSKVSVLCFLLQILILAHCSNNNSNTNDVQKMTLQNVKHWAYNIQDVNTTRQYEQLVGSHFDMYVLEPVVTESGEQDFNIAQLVNDIRQYNIDTRNVDPLIIAYIDVGQAESWRWYWDSSWNSSPASFIVGDDPDGWDDCYVVEFWDTDWKNIVIYGYNGKSHVEESLKAGFDGIYMDWVEAYDDPGVITRANNQGKDAADEMFNFIENIRDYARNESENKNSNYLVIAQNASPLYAENETRYKELIDAIACEGVWYDGTGAFDEWNDSSGYNEFTSNLDPSWFVEVLEDLNEIKNYMPVFCAEYAQDIGGNNYATDAYAKASKAGFKAYCSRRSLSELSTTPYPPGYNPKDY